MFVYSIELKGDNLISEEQFLNWMPKLGRDPVPVVDSVTTRAQTTNKNKDRVLSRSNSTKSNSTGGDDGRASDDEKDLRAAFAVFDQDQNGYITRDELKEAMQLMGEELSEQDIDGVLLKSDTDHDGMINYDEFIRMLI